MDIGIFLLRAVIGLALAAHGAQKLFGAFGGPGIAGTGAFFDTLGFRPGRLFATMAALGETGGGLLVAFGLFTPFAAAVVVSTMLVAVWGVHLEKGFFAQNGGYEYPLVLGVAAVALAFTGPGRLSVDAVLGFARSGPRWGLLALGLGIAGALPPLVAKARALRQSHAS
jgi:putative oxidoreductase